LRSGARRETLVPILHFRMNGGAAFWTHQLELMLADGLKMHSEAGIILMDAAECVALVRRFLEAGVCADADEFAGYHAVDALWWNALWEPFEGEERYAGRCARVPSA